MTNTRKTRRIRKDVIVARVALLIVLASLLAMLVMGIYTFGIAVEARLHTATIAQAYDDSVMYHPSRQQEHIDEVYVEENAARQEVYNRNSYTRWYFYTLKSGFARFGIILAWLAMPVSVIYLVAWDCYLDSKKAKAKSTVRR